MGMDWGRYSAFGGNRKTYTLKMSLFRPKDRLTSHYYVQDAMFLGTYSRPILVGNVDANRTRLTRKEATSHITSALKTVLKRNPTKAEIKMVVAQSDLETGGWSAMWNWNWGNSVATKGSAWFMIPSDTKHKYRPFTSAKEGALYYVAMLKNRFSKAWKLLGSGDTAAFARALKDQKYFEGNKKKTREQQI